MHKLQLKWLYNTKVCSVFVLVVFFYKSVLFVHIESNGKSPPRRRSCRLSANDENLASKVVVSSLKSVTD